MGASQRSGQALERVLHLFTRQYGAGPSVVTSAPGRVNLIGEHTDYNGGDVLPMGIHLRTFVALRQGRGAESVAASSSESGLARFPLNPSRRAGDWGDYLAGVVWAFRQRGLDVPPLRIGVVGDVPVGSGLSSSAALEVAFAFAVNEMLGAALDPRELALIAWRAESQFVGVPCGIMDQFASALAQNGRALHIRAAQITSDSIPFTESVLIFDTAAPRSLRDSEFATRQAECATALEAVQRVNPAVRHLADATHDDLAAAALPEPIGRRARHVVEEQARVARTVEALRTGGRIPGALMYQSHESLRVQYECSSPELDWFVDTVGALEGVRGARMTGAGWGGCAIAAGEREGLAAAASRLETEYEKKFRRRPRTWIAAAEPGARLERDDRARGTR